MAFIPVVASMAILASSTALAELNDETPASLQQLTINGQALTPESVRRVAIEGPIYEVRLRNGDTFYSDAQGRHMLVGSLYDNASDGLINVTEQHNRQKRLDQLSVAIEKNNTVSYPAQGEPVGEVAVFTDTTCPYCQRLHQELDQLTAAGITVHYIPFSRAARESPAAHQLTQVMCSADPQGAMTAVFSGQHLEVTPTEDCQAAIDQDFQLGQRFGVQGTPTIILPSGEMGEGYVPAEQLIQAVEEAVP
ncbi:DsbC family protein [Pistricoccus aurantiacus]|uniref:Thiol:disulfide interchange protein n=1 Tax=Pistricoccus aurantiacus TaxID=1883414 RepID=A0A5B8ST16_9GAMM|nr:DsbC family protein [Pistricoccus aurantiacus]QEA38645.1 DsbC family protein [Pistricoccus aurantiacus]